MVPQFLSVALIAAVIACPLWCAGGECQGSACATEPLHQQAYAACEANSCCCEKGSEAPADSDPQCPCGDSRCQGICGGAVFEKPVEVDEGADGLSLPLDVGDATHRRRVTDCRAGHGIGNHFRLASANQGRFLRTLHMSFLC